AVADLAIKIDREELAADILSRVLKKCPACTPAHRALAEIYLASDDTEAAYPHLLEWASRATDDPVPALKLADLLEAQGQPDKAAGWVQRALDVDLFNLDLQKRHGRLLVAAKRWSEAFKPLQIVTDAKPDDDAAWADLADAYRQAGQKADAIRACEKAISLN